MILQESCLKECWLGEKLRILKYIFGQNNSLVWIKLNTKMGFKHHHHELGEQLKNVRSRKSPISPKNKKVHNSACRQFWGKGGLDLDFHVFSKFKCLKCGPAFDYKRVGYWFFKNMGCWHWVCVDSGGVQSHFHFKPILRGK